VDLQQSSSNTYDLHAQGFINSLLQALALSILYFKLDCANNVPRGKMGQTDQPVYKEQ